MLAYYSALTVSFLLFTFTLKLLRRPYHVVAQYSVAVVDGLMSKLDEEQKVALVQARMNKLLKGLLFGFLALIVAVLVGAIPLLIYVLATNLSYMAMDFSSGYAIIGISIGSTIGFMLPVSKSKSDYSDLSKLLHRMILNHYNISRKLFKRDAKRLQKNTASINEKFVIVSGLARAGTTSLMNHLATDGRFASLSYANMPFLTAPRLWSGVYRKKSPMVKERSHNDGILISTSSNEALEEYFFKMLTNDEYINPDCLVKSQLSEQDYRDYLVYQTLIKQKQDQVYLAKNNNFILHYDLMRARNKEFVLVAMFRDPIHQAGSLKAMHENYCKLQKEDGFVTEYMNWLGHHEFGLNHKVFRFGESEFKIDLDINSIDYWLTVWLNYYNHLLEIDKHNVLFVCYENYCNDPAKVIDSVYERLDFSPPTNRKISPFEPSVRAYKEFSSSLLEEAKGVYQLLIEQQIN